MSKINRFSSHQYIGISIDNCLSIFSVYLPTRSGCTESFKESLDFMQLALEFCNPLGPVIFARDMNADPGPAAGPLLSTTCNEQGRILLCYLKAWDYTSAHLTLNTSSKSHTFENHAKSMLFYNRSYTLLQPSSLTHPVMFSSTG